ncbi:MAG: hypothetical protein A2Y95_13065 [Deltaproteobacteria bacterium RBG_13_65_10]|jgi:uncharacterized protein (DUF1015 family)|nr:MAG: hypothetical protein A2Y95_13065 [Deltaproteobacteria bacterium RBG_13_65_10]
MAIVAAFRGLRYNPAEVPDLGVVVAPPYDVISPQAREALLARSPHNSVRLILEAGADRYALSARRLAQWRACGILVRDAEPAFYVVEDHYHVKDATGHDVERRRLGLVALVRIEPPEARVILPHERTLSGPRADRFHLMSAVNAHLSQVFLLAPDKDGAFEAWLEKLTAGEPGVSFSEPEGASHRLTCLTDRLVQEEIRALLAPRPLLIADGHHRYETARAYRDLRRERDGGIRQDGRAPYDYVMATVASMDDPGTTVLGYHRVVRKTGLSPEVLRARLESRFAVTRVARAGEPAACERLLTAMCEGASRGETAIGMVLHGDEGLYVASRPKGPGEPILDRLDVSVLHRAVFEELLGMTEEEVREQRRIDYTPDPDLALARVTVGSHAAAFLLNPTPPGEVLAVAQAGLVMPQKSTYFYPKLLTGLVFHPMDPGDLL